MGVLHISFEGIDPVIRNLKFSVCECVAVGLSLQMLVKNGAIIAISNKYGDTPLSKARPRLRKKLEALAGEFGQSLVIVPHKSKLFICSNVYYTCA